MDTLDVLIALAAFEGVAGLGEERNDGCARVATDNGDGFVGWIGVFEGRDESRGTDDVKSGDTKQLLGVVDVLGLEDLGGDWDSGVDLENKVRAIEEDGTVSGRYWVGDDEDVGIWTVVCTGFG